ncbi:MAG: Multiple antibiotic resistance protein MarR [Syntrophaceae bacterium PtaB.Bin095]|nr:MAG: Multiple antibiotic resistance protein MarR [Syntrophaceae bacterium PtaB.Bin095]
MQALSDLIIEFYEKLSSWEVSVVTESGLTLPQMHTIEILGGNNLIKMKDLATKMGITTGTLTVMIDNLEKRGLVERVPNPNDRRSYVIRLTDAGFEHYAQHSAFHLNLVRDCTAEFTPEDVEKFSALLKEFVRHI